MKSKKSRSDNICSSITDSKVYCPNVYDGWRMGILLKKFIINSITVISNRTVWNYFNKSYWLRYIDNAVEKGIFWTDQENVIFISLLNTWWVEIILYYYYYFLTLFYFSIIIILTKPIKNRRSTRWSKTELLSVLSTFVL